MISSDLLIILGIIFVVQIIFLILALRDWFSQPEEMPDRMLWLLIILLINILGPIIYFISAPREEQNISPSQQDTGGWDTY